MVLFEDPKDLAAFLAIIVARAGSGEGRNAGVHRPEARCRER
jgi:hypothetical protein